MYITLKTPRLFLNDFRHFSNVFLFKYESSVYIIERYPNSFKSENVGFKILVDTLIVHQNICLA